MRPMDKTLEQQTADWIKGRGELIRSREALRESCGMIISDKPESFVVDYLPEPLQSEVLR